MVSYDQKKHFDLIRELVGRLGASPDHALVAATLTPAETRCVAAGLDWCLVHEGASEELLRFLSGSPRRLVGLKEGEAYPAEKLRMIADQGVDAAGAADLLALSTSPNYFADLLGAVEDAPFWERRRDELFREIMPAVSDSARPAAPSLAEWVSNEVRKLLLLPGVKFLSTNHAIAQELRRRIEDRFQPSPAEELRIQLLIADAIRDACEDLMVDHLARSGAIPASAPPLVQRTGMTTSVLVGDAWVSCVGEDHIHPGDTLGPRWFVTEPSRAERFLQIGKKLVEDHGEEGRELGHLFDLTYFGGVSLAEASRLLGRSMAVLEEDLGYFANEVRILFEEVPCASASASV